MTSSDVSSLGWFSRLIGGPSKDWCQPIVLAGLSGIFGDRSNGSEATMNSSDVVSEIGGRGSPAQVGQRMCGRYVPREKSMETIRPELALHGRQPRIPNAERLALSGAIKEASK